MKIKYMIYALIILLESKINHVIAKDLIKDIRKKKEDKQAEEIFERLCKAN